MSPRLQQVLEKLLDSHPKNDRNWSNKFSRCKPSKLAAILTFLGVLPIVGGVLLAIPTAVFGGAVMLMFGTVAVAGFNILKEVNLDNRSFVILAVSLAAGLGVTFLPEALHGFPEGVRSILESGIATGSICALVLNLIFPRPKELDDTVVVEPTEASAIRSRDSSEY